MKVINNFGILVKIVVTYTNKKKRKIAYNCNDLDLIKHLIIIFQTMYTYICIVISRLKTHKIKKIIQT
jgi:hypothetical protein